MYKKYIYNILPGIDSMGYPYIFNLYFRSRVVVHTYIHTYIHVQ